MLPIFRHLKPADMKKIIAAFDGLKFSEGTRDWAVYLTKNSDTHLVGISLEDTSYTSYRIFDLVTPEGVAAGRQKQLDEADQLTRMQSAHHFEAACQAAGVEFSMHHDRRYSSIELKHESIYADLLLINSSETFNHYQEDPPTLFVRDLLADVQCPVLLVPVKFIQPEKLILLYDGAPASVYAAKMFSYLLPRFKRLNTEVITVKNSHSSLHLPNNKLMKEFMKRHYPKAKYIIKKGNSEDEIVHLLKEYTGNAIVVLGAYGRSGISRWFHESMADRLMKQLKLPLFIAHSR